MPHTDPRSADESTVFEDLRKWRALDTTEDVSRRVMRAMRTAETVMYGKYTDDAMRLKAATVVQQTARTYLACLEAHELEARVEALEAAMEERQNARGDGAPALSTYN
jgi:hypothetical protein